MSQHDTPQTKPTKVMVEVAEVECQIRKFRFIADGDSNDAEHDAALDLIEAIEQLLRVLRRGDG